MNHIYRLYIYEYGLEYGLEDNIFYLHGTFDSLKGPLYWGISTWTPEQIATIYREPRSRFLWISPTFEVASRYILLKYSYKCDDVVEFCSSDDLYLTDDWIRKIYDKNNCNWMVINICMGHTDIRDL